MTSVDSGVETSNDSNDSSITHESRSIEISPSKLNPGTTQANVPHLTVNTCEMNASLSDKNGEEVEDKEEKKLKQTRLDTKYKLHNRLPYDVEPPAGISFCNLQPSLEFETKGYEVLSHGIGQGVPVDSYQQAFLKTKMHLKCIRRRRTSWLKCLLDERKLRYAAVMNDEERVTNLLEACVNPNCIDTHLRSPLHLASCRGYTNVVRLLLDKGANPNQRDSLGNTPLHLAACTNNVEVVTLLLKAGTDITSSDYYGRNPLQLAQSKLKLLQRGTANEDSLKIKCEVQKVIEMMLTFLHKKGQDAEAQLWNDFQTMLTMSETKEQVETNVRDILTSLTNLSINKTDSDP